MYVYISRNNNMLNNVKCFIFLNSNIMKRDAILGYVYSPEKYIHLCRYVNAFNDVYYVYQD